jgi:hypothetical protein
MKDEDGCCDDLKRYDCHFRVYIEIPSHNSWVEKSGLSSRTEEDEEAVN